MLTTEEKRFFAFMSREASLLSKCSEPQGAILVTEHRVIAGHRIASHGFNKKIIPNLNYEISAVYDAIFAALSVDLLNPLLFLSYFPSVEDLKLIIAMGIQTLYFFGEIKDTESVALMNALPQNGIPLEIIHFE